MELEGFEPSTPCMPCKCSAELSYSPMGKAIVAQGIATAIKLSTRSETAARRAPESGAPLPLGQRRR